MVPLLQDDGCWLVDHEDGFGVDGGVMDADGRERLNAGEFLDYHGRYLCVDPFASGLDDLRDIDAWDAGAVGAMGHEDVVLTAVARPLLPFVL